MVNEARLTIGLRGPSIRRPKSWYLLLEDRDAYLVTLRSPSPFYYFSKVRVLRVLTYFRASYESITSRSSFHIHRKNLPIGIVDPDHISLHFATQHTTRLNKTGKYAATKLRLRKSVLPCLTYMDLLQMSHLESACIS